MSQTADIPTWVAVDWGTSHVRLWLMASDGAVLRRLDSDQGMGHLSPDQFEPAVLELLTPHLGDTALTVICCGMAGSRQGWAEAPYAATPCPPPSLENATQVKTNDRRLNVSILPGIKQVAPADVMRGEETQIAGVIAKRPGFDGVVCLPGTHTKWARVRDGMVQSFGTFMTGEMFALLSESSVLRHTVGTTGWDPQAFGQAVEQAVKDPNTLSASLFSLRAQALLAELPPPVARARLSGLLIGTELSAAQNYWHSGDVVVVGENALANAYAEALKLQNITPALFNAEQMTLSGLTAAYDKIKDQIS